MIEILFIAFEMFVYSGISWGIVFKANMYLKSKDMFNLHHGVGKFYMIKESMST